MDAAPVCTSYCPHASLSALIRIFYNLFMDLSSYWTPWDRKYLIHWSLASPVLTQRHTDYCWINKHLMLSAQSIYPCDLQFGHIFEIRFLVLGILTCTSHFPVVVMCLVHQFFLLWWITSVSLKASSSKQNFIYVTKPSKPFKTCLPH